MKTLSASLGVVGRKTFPFRLPIGLAITVIAAMWIDPSPFFGRGYRMLHLLALLVISAGLALRAWGAGSAGLHTRTSEIEAPRLATAGPYAHLRNPIYLGSILIGTGMSLLLGDPLALAFAAAALALLYFGIIPAEEEFLQRQFGVAYQRYCEAVPRLIPRIRPWSGSSKNTFRWCAVRGELSILGVLVLIYAGFVLKALLVAHRSA